MFPYRKLTFWSLLLLIMYQTTFAEKGYYHPNASSAFLESPGTIIAAIHHRFTGEAFDKPLESILGTRGGANVSIALSYALPFGISVHAERVWNPGDNRLGVGYRPPLELVAIPFIGIDFFSLKDPPSDEWQRNFYYYGGVEVPIIGERLRPVLFGGYDGYRNNFGGGMALDGILFEGSGTMEHVRMFGEFFFRGTDPVYDSYHSYSIGFGIKTWGHDFMIYYGNSSHINSRDGSLGSDGLKPRYSFKVTRIFGRE